MLIRILEELETTFYESSANTENVEIFIFAWSFFKDADLQCDKFQAVELDTTSMETCQKDDQEVTLRPNHHYHHVCRFDCNHRHGDTIIDDDYSDANDIQQHRSNFRALMIVTTLIGIVSSFFAYLLPFLVFDAENDKTVASLLAILYMSAALTSLPIMATFLPLYRKESNIRQG